jgi:hypothetical protein
LATEGIGPEAVMPFSPGMYVNRQQLDRALFATL